MALRLWSRHANGLSQLVPACQFLCNNLSTVKAYGSAAEDGHAEAALEKLSRTSDRKKERLSRQERTAIVESYVLKHMEAHGGAFPSVSAVLKETGGGRSAVKGILSDVESRLQTNKQTSSEENLVVGPAGALHETSSGTSSEDSEEDELDTEGVSSEEIVDELGEISETERKSVTFTNGQMIGSSQGEIETHSGLWSRLRKLGSKQQRRSQKASSDTSSNGVQTRQDVTTGSVALSFSDAADLDIKKKPQNGGSNGQELQDPKMEGRHGLFIRYLSPQATPADLKEAFGDCGEIVRAQAIKPRVHQKFTYGFVDFKTSEALQKALEKDKVYVKGVRIRKEPSSSTPKTADRNGNSNPLTIDFSSPRVGTEDNVGSFLGPLKSKGKGTGYSIAVEGVPLHIPLTVVKRALSQYGEIALSSKKRVGQGDYTAHVEFKGDDARKRALSAKMVQLSGMQYAILRVDPVKTSVVRVSNVGAKMSAEQIQASCEQIGRVDKIVTRCDGVVDVYFHSTELENMPRIMNRLNEVNVEGQIWQAQPSSCIDPSSFLYLMRTRDGQEWVQQESERMLGRVEGALRHLVVDVEDLQNVVKMKREYSAS